MRSIFYIRRVLSIFCLFLFLLSTGARANNFYVTNLGDAGPGSLRQAIMDANNTSAGMPHAIVFQVSGSIIVQTSLPVITSAGMTIDGGNRITINTAQGGDNGITFFDINASNVRVRNFTLLNSGGRYLQVEPNLSGDTIQNIVANQYTGYYMDYIVYVVGASTNLTLRNIRCSMGLQINSGSPSSNWNFFFFNAGRQTNLVMDSIFVSNGTTNYNSGGIYFNSTPINGWTFTNSRIACVSNPIYLNDGGTDTATNVLIRNVTLDSTGGSFGFYSNCINIGVTIRNALFTANQAGTYGIRFVNRGKGLTLDSLAIYGNNTYTCVFDGGADSNVTISHSTFKNSRGPTTNQTIAFNQPLVNLTMVKDSIDETISGTSAGQYGVVFNAPVTNVSMDSMVVSKASVDGIYVNSTVNGFTLNHSKLTGNAVGLDMLANTGHSNVSILNSSFLNGTNASAGAFQFNSTTLPQQFKFQNDTVASNAGSGLRAYGGSAAITDTITNCAIYNNGTYGVLMDNSPTQVVVGTNNSIYNNASGGIGMTGNGNCGYTSANSKAPVMVSSTPMGGGQYQLYITVPNISVGALYSLDIYANDAGTSAASGQYYVKTINNIPYNSGTPQAYIVNYNTGPGATGKGFWTATLRIPGNPCGTSAFSNQMAMSPQGPAGVNSGIVTWLRADDGKASGAAWGDFSGNGATAFQPVTGSQPAFDTAGLNFNPGLKFNGSNTGMQIPNSAITGLFPFGNSDRTLITVSSNTSTNQGWIFSYGSASNGTGNGFYLPPTQQPVFWGYYSDLVATNPYPLNKSLLLAGTHAAAGGSPNTYIYVNGANGNPTNTASLTWNTNSTLPANIGIDPNGTNRWTGDVGEVILYNRVLSNTELIQVNSYLALKYGITLNAGAVNYLASDGNPYWTFNSTYNRRITGIGRDSITALYQKQSLNVDTGVVTLALGSAVAASNAANTSTIAANKSFFVFADNGGVTGLSVALTASGLKSNQRMGRVWMVQKTANWGDQPITLKIAGTGVNNYLLVSSDPAFGTVSQELQLDAGGNVTLNSSLLASGSYFTVGGSPRGPGNVNSGIALWLRADDGKATGAQWNDYSGNGNGAAQPITANQALAVQSAFNFNRGLRFNGTNNLTVPYNPAFNGSVTVYTVYNQLNAGNVQTPICSRNSSTALGWNLHIDYTQSNRRGWYTAYGGNYDIQVDGTYTNKQPEIMGLMATPGKGTASKNMYLNGSPLLATPTTNSSYSSNTTTPLYIGSVDGGAYPWNGDIAEAIVYSRVLSATERQQVESYLALKYGITLNGGATNYLASNGATTFWNVGTNSGYVKHVTGIGRDSATGLYQKQSRGVDTGYITLALGSAVAAANELNTATIAADTSFFVIGDNGGLKAFTGNVQAGTVTFTPLGRVFRVQKTNWTNQNITLATDTTLPLPQDLLISTDPTFATGVTVKSLTRGVVTLNSSQLASGVYFTFADTVRGPGGVNTGIGAWWRADAGGSVSSWTDYSGYGRTQAQTTAASQPTLQPSGVNFNPALYFNGSNYMTSPSVFGTGSIQNSAIFAVAMPTNASAWGGLFGENLNGGQILVYAPNSNGNMYFYAPNESSGNFIASGPWGGTYGNPYLFGFTRSPQGTSIQASLNNNMVASKNGALPNFVGNNSPFYLGSQSSTAYSYIGQVAELVVYSNSATMLAGDRQKIMSYLGFKYGLTLKPLPSGGASPGYVASNGVLFWDSTVNAGYNLHITGVGRDSTSGLYQLQAISADTGLVTLALGNTIAASNAANTSVIGTDRSFFVFGDNGGATTYLTGLSGLPGLTTRMARVFKVQKTGWTDQVITMKIKGATSGTYLIVSSDPTFGSGVTKYVFSDSTIHVNSLVLGNGVYFTFARQTPAPNGVSNGLALWLRADDGVSNGTQWNDQTGNGMNAVQAAPGNQPVLDARAINFNYGLQFNASTNMQVPVGAIANFLPFGNADRTMISVATQTANVGLAAIMDYGNTSGNGTTSGLAVYSNNGVPLLWGYYYDIGGPAGTYPLNKPMFISGSRTATGSPNSYLYANGTRVGMGTYAWNTPATIPLNLGQDMNGGSHFSGPISELIIYNRALSATDSQQVYSYLSLKYGLTMNAGTVNYLASDGSPYWTANSTYNRRITGIGRDDTTMLYTKQSLSADTGFVTLALGSSVALTNQANTATINNNKSFFVFADNGGSVNNFSTAVSGSTHGVTLRYARVWMVQKTAGWADQNITLKVAPIGLNNYLLISSDPNFGSVTSELPIKPDSTVTLNSSLFNSGNIYFSFGAPILAPGGVAGHALWLRADVGAGTTTNGTAVSQWSDQSAFANNVSQSTAANQPVYGDNATDDINFNPVMKFNGNVTYLTGGSMLKTGTYNGAAAFVVNSQISPAASSMFYENSTGGQFNLHATFSDNTVYWDAPITSNRISFPVGNINNLVNLWTGTSDITLSSNKQQIYRNGLSLTTGNNSSTYTGTNSTLYIGGTVGYSSYYGRIPEIIVYTFGLTAPQQQQVNSYMALKYGITLNNGQTPYLATDGVKVWDTTGIPAYRSGITGIGRDSVEGLNQLQSRNSDTTRLRIAIGLGEIDSTNSAHLNKFAADRSYMVWGDDNGPAGYLTAVSGIAGINFRMMRTWKVQERGSVGNVQVAIPFSAVPNPAGAVLLVSNTGTFDATSTAYPLNQVVMIAGVKHYAATLNFINGQYFSFAANVKAPGGVSGTYLWLRPDQGTSSTSDKASLNVWTDYGNQVNTAIQNTVANQPVYFNNATSNVNFNPMVQFTAANAQTMSLDVTKLPTGINPRTIFGTSKPSTTPSGYLITWGAAGTYQGTGMGSSGGTGYFLGYSNDMQTTATNVWQGGVVGEQMNMWTGAAGGNIASIYSKGLSLAPSPQTYASWNTGATSALLGGPYWSAGSNWNGSVGDVIVYGRALTATEIQRVETYLAIRYGYTMDQTTAKDYLATDGTTKVWDATANATYKNGITGIGYDTTEGLLQLQSRNSDTTRLRIAVGLGEIDSVNSANLNSFGADKSYLIWGDDNQSTGFTTAVSGITGVNYRMTRTWKAQLTGSVGNVQIAIPFSALPNPGSAVLLVSNTGVFDATSTVYPLKVTVTPIAGVRHYAATLSLTSGQYFTFATNVKAPGGVTGTSLWLRADRGLGGLPDGSAVSAWTDYGNQVNTVYQNTAANQPVYSNNTTDNINFDPVMKLNGTSAYLTGASMLKGVTYNGAAAFVVGNPTSLTNSAVFHEGLSSNYFDFQVPWSNGSVTWVVNSGISYTLGAMTNQSMLWTGTYDGTLASNNLGLYQNGLLRTTGNYTGNYTGNNSPLYIGEFPGSGFYNGRIPEIIVYTSALTPTQQTQVNTYLAIKYGITLNGGATAYLATDGTTTIWPVDGIYKNGITGIGRDSVEDLNQKQSRNSDTTRLRVVVGLGEIDSTNSANRNVFGADKSYLVWGDDNGASTFQTPLSGNPAVNYRMGRTWKSVLTGSVGNVVVAFPYDVLPNPAQSFLAVSSSAVFDGTSTYIPLTKMTINGKQHWGATVGFSGTQYFTVAAFIKSPGGVGLTSLWLRPDKGILGAADGQSVPLWVDFANQVNNASQANILNQPTYRQSQTFNVNYNPVVTFASASSQFMNLDITKLPTGTIGRTIFGMGVPGAALTTNGYLISWGTAATSQGSGMLYGTSGQGIFMGYSDDVVTANNFWQNGVFSEQMNIWAGTASGSSATIYSKGLQVATPVIKSGWNTGTTGAAVGGAFFGAGQYWNGSIGDVIVFNRQLSAAEINRVETYLAIRYGYTIDQTSGAPNSNYTRTDGVPVWTANTTYKYNIAGIGRDDVEGLNQLQSRSINAASIMTVGLGGIAADNPSNTNSFASDTSYVVWASSSTSTAAQATNLPAGYSNTTRMVQQWKMKQTNFSNASLPLSISFDLTGFSYSDTGPNNLVLLVDNDGDGDLTTGTVQKIPSTFYSSAQKLVRFDNVTTIPDGAVITLAFVKNVLQLNAKVYLQASWNGTSMSTTLQANGQLPATDPYGLNTTPTVNPNSATAQVVDWVKVELRDPVTPTTVISSRAALLLADGTIVDTNYTQPLSFGVPTTQYYVVIKHRNHLGIMTGSAVDFSSGAATLDFTGSATATYSRGTNPAQASLISGINMMWGGDANGDGKIIFTGTGSDADWILSSALSGDPNGYLYLYHNGDVNMDGQVYYISTNNDRDWILYYPLGGNQNGSLEAQLP